MKRRPRTANLPPLFWLAGAFVAVLLGMAPRSHLVVCMQRLGAAPARAHCDRCRVHRCECGAAVRAPLPRAPGEERVTARCPTGCCVDLQTEIEVGPVPRADVAPPPLFVSPAAAPVLAQTALPHADARDWPHDTGPPRVDSRTRLLATTVLRL